MTLILVQKFLRDLRVPLLVVMLILFSFSAFWVKIAQRVTSEIAPFFNAIASISQVSPKLFEEVVFKGPGKVSQSVMGGADVQFERPSDFLAVELLHPVVLMLTCIWAVGRAAGAIAGELDRGTMELLLSQPIPRHTLIVAHLVVDAIVIPLLCASIWLGTNVGLWAVGPFVVDHSVLDKLPKPMAGFTLPKGPDVLEVSVAGQPAALVNLAGLYFAMSGLTLLISSLNRSRWRAMGFAVLLILGMFVVNVLGQLWNTAAVLRPLSLFFYYQPQKIWLKDDYAAELGEAFSNGQPLARVPVLLVQFSVGALGYLAAARVFTRRDLPAPL